MAQPKGPIKHSSFRYLKLGDGKALPKDTEISELGRINILCGRNASGKSTLLQMLHEGKRSFGRDLREEAFEHLCNLCAGGRAWRDTVWEFPFRQLVLATVNERPRGVWYSEEANAFRQVFEAKFRESSLRGNVGGFDLVENQFNSLFPKDLPRSVLIPAKRQLEIVTSLQVSGGVDPKGTGILNQLFFAQTQLPGTPERRFLESLQKAFSEISSGWFLAVESKVNNQIGLHFAPNLAGEWVAAGACGQGLHDLLHILYFTLKDDNDVLCVEEPENHMHPDMQRRLLGFFRDGTAKQFFIATHSNVFLNATLTDKVLFTTFEKHVRIDDATSRAAVLSDLGYAVTDNLISDLVILVEGPSDVPVIEEFLRKWKIAPHFNIKTWPLGGDIMDQIDLSVFAGRYKLIAVVDKDPGSAAIRRRFEANCQQLGIPIHRLERYSIENYFTLDALRSVFKGQIAAEVLALNPDVKIEDQIGLNPKKSNRLLAEATDRASLESTDIAGFMEQVRLICDS